MNPNQPVPAGQINQQQIQQVAPDVSSPQGQQQLFHKAISANVAKKQLDAVMEAVSEHLKGSFSTRVKDIDTASKKIVQKRLAGRNEYNIDSINDMLGGRIVVNSDKDIPKAKQAIEKLSQAGVFEINKQQKVKQGTYLSYHYDVTMSNGTKAELQVHTPQSEAEAVVNHSLRATAGENPADGAVEQLRNKQAQVAKSLPNDKAKAVSGALQQMMKAQGGQVAPQQSAQLLAQAQQ